MSVWKIYYRIERHHTVSFTLVAKKQKIYYRIERILAEPWGPSSIFVDREDLL